jgi:hypothetical protein
MQCVKKCFRLVRSFLSLECIISLTADSPSLTSGGTNSADCPAKKVSKFNLFVHKGISQYDFTCRLLWRKSDQ